MVSMKLITSFVVTLGLALTASAAPTENEGHLRTRDQGLRGCIGGAIQCNYANGRCAKICSGDGKSLSSICSCPDVSPDNGSAYTGAGCINVFTAAGRHGC